MTVSVVCPTYNSSSFIEKTLQCIVDQTKKPDEVIFCDDGSTDNTCEVIEDFFLKNDFKNFKIIKNSHSGPGAARNACIKLATSEWISFLDSDDVWEKNKIEVILKNIESNPSTNFICHNEKCFKVNQFVKNNYYSEKFDSSKDLSSQLYIANLFSTSAVTCKRSLIVNSSGFDESLMSAQDYDLWLNIAPKINVLFLDEFLGSYILRDGNISSGSLYKRYKNEMRIASRYAPRFNAKMVCFKILRIHISFLMQIFRGLV